nr:uncharacterized protein LOC117601672 [Osmia lignaria]
MSSEPILNPPIPYVGAVENGLIPGKMVKIQGKVPSDAIRFAVNYQLGPTLNPRDDIAIHVSPRFQDGFITRNHIMSMSWGPEENEGPLCIQPGQEFEIFILCDHGCYKIAINGRHFAEFVHRLPYQKVTHLVIDGDVEVNSITYENVSTGPPPSTPTPDVPNVNVGPPPPGGLYPTIGSQAQPQVGYGPNAYFPPNPYAGPNYNLPHAYGYQPGYEKPEEEDAFKGCLDKVGLAIGGLVAAGGIAAAAHAMNKKKDEGEKNQEKSDASNLKTESEGGGLGNLGSLGAALASSLVNFNTSQSNLSAQQGYPPQQSNSGVLGSLLGALGGSGNNVPAQPPSQPTDPLKGAIGSFLGGVLGGGGNQQPNYQSSGGYGGNYQPSGGYSNPQTNSNSDFLSGIGSTIGSSLLSSAFDSFGKHGKEKSHGDSHSVSPQPHVLDPSPSVQTPTHSDSSSTSGQKLSADEISKGLGLDN